MGLAWRSLIAFPFLKRHSKSSYWKPIQIKIWINIHFSVQVWSLCPQTPNPIKSQNPRISRCGHNGHVMVMMFYWKGPTKVGDAKGKADLTGFEKYRRKKDNQVAWEYSAALVTPWRRFLLKLLFMSQQMLRKEHLKEIDVTIYKSISIWKEVLHKQIRQ